MFTVEKCGQNKANGTNKEHVCVCVCLWLIIHAAKSCALYMLRWDTLVYHNLCMRGGSASMHNEWRCEISDEVRKVTSAIRRWLAEKIWEKKHELTPRWPKTESAKLYAKWKWLWWKYVNIRCLKYKVLWFQFLKHKCDSVQEMWDKLSSYNLNYTDINW